MPAFTLLSLSNINFAIDTVTNVRGVYQSIGLLAKAFSEVEETDDFKNEVRKLETEQGPLYQGPDNSRESILKAAKTAANGDLEQQNAIAQLVSLVIQRFGTSQGTKLLGFLLLAAGYDPTLLVFVVRVCSYLAGTETGKEVLEQARPQLSKLAEATGQSKLFKPILSAAQTAGETGANWAESISAAATSSVVAATQLAKETAKSARDTSQSALDSLVTNLKTADEDTEQASREPTESRSASSRTSSWTNTSFTPIWDQPRDGNSSTNANPAVTADLAGDNSAATDSHGSATAEEEREPTRPKQTMDNAEPAAARQTNRERANRERASRERADREEPPQRELVRKPTRQSKLDDELDDILILDDLTVAEVVPLKKSDHKVAQLKREHEIVDAEIVFLDE